METRISRALFQMRGAGGGLEEGQPEGTVILPERIWAERLPVAGRRMRIFLCAR